MRSPTVAASPNSIGAASLVACLTLAGCVDVEEPMAPGVRAPETPSSAIVPSDLWPFTSETASLSTPQDPINLIFTGVAGARNVRAALLSLDGHRSPPFPAAFPFDCTWQDAMGGPQTAFSDSEGWVGGVIQLECGEFDPVRFHVRLFDVGDVTAGNAHLDLLIPGTAEHQVIAWEAAEQFVAFDVARTGLLGAAPAQTGPINPAPTYREIPAAVYNGIPTALRVFAGTTPVAGDASGPVGIVSDGSATILTLAASAPEDATPIQRVLELQFGQIIPNPFCSLGPLDFLRLEGGATLTLAVDPAPGAFGYHFLVHGRALLTPVNPVTAQPTGETFAAEIHENYVGQITDAGADLTGTLLRMKLPPHQDGHGRFSRHLHVGPTGSPRFSQVEDCR